MKPVPLSEFRLNIFNIFKAMRDLGGIFEVSHRRKIYRIHIEDTGRRITTPYTIRMPKDIVPSAMIDTKPCPDCESMLVSGLCMNVDCSSYLRTV